MNAKQLRDPVKTRLDVEENPLINTSATFPFIFPPFLFFSPP